MRSVEQVGGRYQLSGRNAGAMLAAAAVALSAAIAVAWGSPAQAGPLIGLVIVSVSVLAGLAVIRLRGDQHVEGLVTDLVDRHRRIEQINRFDSLTGVMARAFFLDSFKSRIRGEDGRTGLALLLIDIDRFKWVNDTFGHDMGDAMLAHVGDVLTSRFPEALVGRLGGDEFAVVFAGPVSARTCAWAGERILEALREPAQLLGRSMRTEATIGVAWAPEHATTSDNLISCADLALYEAKRSGRRCVGIYDDELMKQRRHDAFITRELRAAILLDHLELHYQPLVRLADGKVFSVEALVRWRHPVRGIIPPRDFVRIAESSALIEMLGEWVLRRACRDGRLWPGLRIGINVSPRQLRHPDFAEHVMKVFEEEAISPGRFVFEITENVLLECTERHREQLRKLREGGIRLSLDDFGAGHSSLGYLRDFTFDSLKIDSSFVMDLERSRTSQVFVAAITHVGHGLDMTVVGEGVETESQARMLRAAGCDFVQGFLFSRPVPAAAITAMLKAGSPDADRIRDAAGGY